MCEVCRMREGVNPVSGPAAQIVYLCDHCLRAYEEDRESRHLPEKAS